jgi:hypothetical protein
VRFDEWLSGVGSVAANVTLGVLPLLKMGGIGLERARPSIHFDHGAVLVSMPCVR